MIVLALRRLLEVLEALGLASKVLEAAIPKATATMRTILNALLFCVKRRMRLLVG